MVVSRYYLSSSIGFKIIEFGERHGTTMILQFGRVTRLIVRTHTEPDALYFRGKYKIALYAKIKCDQRDSRFGHGNAYVWRTLCCFIYFCVQYKPKKKKKRKRSN